MLWLGILIGIVLTIVMIGVGIFAFSILYMNEEYDTNNTASPLRKHNRSDYYRIRADADESSESNEVG